MGRNKGADQEKREVKYSLEFHPDVEFDLQEAYDYYEEQRGGLGDELLLSIEASIEYITRQPGHFAIVSSHTRRCITKRFPFGVFYFIEGGKIFITAVLHLSRNPKIWKNRTPSR
ncbi:MAG: addiction module toxin RelE [Bacteroidota bacterium]|nr:addiction module toxin RelE [Bacteroidota bacterium]